MHRTPDLREIRSSELDAYRIEAENRASTAMNTARLSILEAGLLSREERQGQTRICEYDNRTMAHDKSCPS